MPDLSDRFRVALVAGTLGQGGAEKQLVYMAQALSSAGIDVRVFSLSRGEFYEDALRSKDLRPTWVGPFANPMLRLYVLTRMLRNYRPHVVQSAHTFTNLYVSTIGRLTGSISLGTMRSSLAHTREANGLWTRWLVRTPDALLVNSQAALNELIKSGLLSQRLWFLPNVISLREFDASGAAMATPRTGQRRTCRAAFVGRLIPVKRVDRFLRALAIVCRRHAGLEGVVVGDGPGRKSAERLAAEIGLSAGRITFLGQRSDVPAILGESDLLVLCSDHEGFPNVALEAMAARLPVVATPAGDAGLVVRDGVTGYVVQFDNLDGMADRMLRLARSPDLRRRLGEAGRRRVEEEYSVESLSARLLSIYRSIAQRQGNPHVLRALEPYLGVSSRSTVLST